MIRTIFKTNLDLARCDKHCWPTLLSFVPLVGMLFRSPFKWGHFQLELEVVSTTWVFGSHEAIDRGIVVEDHLEVELHLPRGRFESLRSFFTMYEKLTGQKFI